MQRSMSIGKLLSQTLARLCARIPSAPWQEYVSPYLFCDFPLRCTPALLQCFLRNGDRRNGFVRAGWRFASRNRSEPQQWPFCRNVPRDRGRSAGCECANLCCAFACSFVRRTVLWGCVCMIRCVFQAMDGTFSRVASSIKCIQCYNVAYTEFWMMKTMCY